MKHRFPKMLLDNEPHKVNCVIADCTKQDLESGDNVEYQPARKLGNTPWISLSPKKAIVLFVGDNEIHLATATYYTMLCVRRIDNAPELPTHSLYQKEQQYKRDQKSREHRMRKARV